MSDFSNKGVDDEDRGPGAVRGRPARQVEESRSDHRDGSPRGAHVSRARDSAPAGSQSVAGQGVVLYAAQSCELAGVEVDNLSGRWDGVTGVMDSYVDKPRSWGISSCGGGSWVGSVV